MNNILDTKTYRFNIFFNYIPTWPLKTFSKSESTIEWSIGLDGRELGGWDALLCFIMFCVELHMWVSTIQLEICITIEIKSTIFTEREDIWTVHTYFPPLFKNFLKHDWWRYVLDDWVCSDVSNSIISTVVGNMDTGFFHPCLGGYLIHTSNKIKIL